MGGNPLSRAGTLFPALALGVLSLLILEGCGDDGATGPDTSSLEILVLGGDGQSAGPETVLPEPLRVRVQALSNGTVKEGIKVRWEILEGSGARLDRASSLTDSAGVAEAQLTLGSQLGRYRVRASVSGMLSPPADFQAQAILDPELTLVPGGPVGAGDIVRLEGRNFSPRPEDNVVTFSGIRGRVMSAASTELQVQVPECLPTREVAVAVRIGTLKTDSRMMEVLEGGSYLSLDPGEDRILDASEGLSCFRLPSIPGSSYLAVSHSTGTVGGAEYPVQLLGLTQDGLHPTSQGGPARQAPPPTGVPQTGGSGTVLDGHWEWESRFRSMERDWLRGRLKARKEPAAPEWRSASQDPQVGDTRKFKVLNSDNGFDDVTARVRYVTDHSVIFVDEETPSGGFTEEDLVFFAREFDDPIHSTVTDIFGAESDLDQNGRVIILFTPGVNRLTEESTEGYVGGFFFGVDLQPDLPGSNQGEIFYAVVPDPTGIHGPVLNRTTLLNSLPSILAHEFEHMVHFNRRILEADASSQDALWLSEALAQMAEDLVGETCLDRGDPAGAMEYQLGNWSRARRFLQNPSQVSVLATLPPGTLAERGAGWLLLKHLFGRDGAKELIRALTGSTRTGVANVTGATGRNWPDIVSDWAGSLYLDGLPVPVRDGLSVQGVNLRDVLSRVSGSYPLSPATVGGMSFSISGSLWSSAPDYHILTTPVYGGLAVNLSGAGGQAPGTASGLRILVVRLQ